MATQSRGHGTLTLKLSSGNAEGQFEEDVRDGQLDNGKHGEISLPKELIQRFQMKPATSIRVVETRYGILLIPLSKKPMSEELVEELKEWQCLSTASWDAYPYEE